MLNTTDKIIKHKTGLLNLAEERGNVSKACQVMHCPAVDCRATGMIPKGDKATRLLGVTPMIEGRRIAIPKEATWLPCSDQ